MDLLFAVFFFILGCIIGSFLNVVILRYHAGPFRLGRSVCFSCGKDLRWFELVPVISFIALRGRCARCGGRISFQYPLVEFLTGAVFLSVWLKLQPLILPPDYILFSYTLIVFCVLLVIAVYDIRHKIIPNGAVYLFVALSLYGPFAKHSVGALFGFPAILDAAAGLILALPFALLWLVSRGRWIGLGDAKLALGIGWFLGFAHGLSVVFLGFWIGAAVSVALLFYSRLRRSSHTLTIKSEIPFAPFLILAFALVYFAGWDVVGFEALLQ